MHHGDHQRKNVVVGRMQEQLADGSAEQVKKDAEQGDDSGCDKKSGSDAFLYSPVMFGTIILRRKRRDCSCKRIGGKPDQKIQFSAESPGCNGICAVALILVWIIMLAIG